MKKTNHQGPVFDREGYQVHLADLNGEPLPDLARGRVLTENQIRALGIPSPSQLAAEEKMEKITIELEKTSLDFFRKEAARHHASYQRMIRNLLSAYARGMSKA